MNKPDHERELHIEEQHMEEWQTNRLLMEEPRMNELGIDAAHLIEMRRYLHRQPELSGYEKNTLKFISAELDALGIPYHEVEKGGIIALITGEAGGPGVLNGTLNTLDALGTLTGGGNRAADVTLAGGGNRAKDGTVRKVLLRADMDALPMEEDRNNLKQEKQVLSEVSGAAHTCGHDAHTAMLLAAAKVLQEKRGLFSGTVILCFERAEETGGPDQTYGYGRLFRYMDENGLSPDACFALHVDPDLACGHISAEPGGVYAGGFGFGVSIKGSGGHGSRPDKANNPLDCFLSFYQTLQGMPMRQLDPFAMLTFSIPFVRMGDTANVISEELYFEGTARSLSKATLTAFKDRFFELLQGTCGLYGCSYEVKMQWLTDPVVNRASDAERIRELTVRHLGKDSYEAAPPTLSSETFAHYTDHYGGAIAFLGVKDEELGSGAPIHSPQFDLNEEALTAGAALHVLFALDALGALNVLGGPEA